MGVAGQSFEKRVKTRAEHKATAEARHIERERKAAIRKSERIERKRKEQLNKVVENHATRNAMTLMRAEDIDSPVAARYLNILANMIQDQGGADRSTEARIQLTRRFAALAVHAEMLDTAFLTGKEINIWQYAVIASTLCRISSRIGLRRAAKQVPYLEEYLEVAANNKIEEQEPLEPGIDEAHTSNGRRRNNGE
jgi:hypothetical protein